jgi:hypothetical protein
MMRPFGIAAVAELLVAFYALRAGVFVNACVCRGKKTFRWSARWTGG